LCCGPSVRGVKVKRQKGGVEGGWRIEKRDWEGREENTSEVLNFINAEGKHQGRTRGDAWVNWGNGGARKTEGKEKETWGARGARTWGEKSLVPGTEGLASEK